MKPTQEQLEAGLLRALHMTANNEGRWEKRREEGCTDDQLARAIAWEFGIQAGYHSREITYQAFGCEPASGWHMDIFDPAKVKAVHPRFEVGKYSDPDVVIKGQPLIDLARRLLAIPVPLGSGGQGVLF